MRYALIDNTRRLEKRALMIILAAIVLIAVFPAAGLAQHPSGLMVWRPDAEEPCAEISVFARARCLREEDARHEKMKRASREYHAWLADRLAEDGGARNFALAANLRALSLGGELFYTSANLPLLEGDARLAEWVDRASRDVGGDGLVHMLLIRPFSPRDEARVQAARDAWRDADRANLAPLRDDDAAIGDPDRGTYLRWIAFYGSSFEPAAFRYTESKAAGACRPTTSARTASTSEFQSSLYGTASIIGNRCSAISPADLG